MQELIDLQVPQDFEKGTELFNSGDIAGAELIFRQMSESDPENSMVWNNLGVAVYQLGKIIEAERSFIKACETGPENISAIKNLADLLFSAKKHIDAEKLYLVLIEKDPSEISNFLNLGDCYITFAEYKTAYEIYKKADEKFPGISAVTNRINIVASAITPLPFEISPPSGKKLTIGTYNDPKCIDTIFDKSKFDLVHLSGGQVTREYFLDPLDITLCFNDFSLYSENLPALCRIVILDTMPNDISLDLTQQLTNIDFILCSSENIRRTLTKDYDFEEYQIVIEESIDVENINAAVLNSRIEELYAEMVLYYADRLEMQDNHEQVNWLLESASKKLPDRSGLISRLERSKHIVNHLFNPEDYKKLYDRSADVSTFNADITNIKRYAWLVEQVRSHSEIKNIIDAGCHKGEFCYSLAKEGYALTGVDIAEKNVSTAKEKLSELEDCIMPEIYHCRAEDMHSRFAGDTFDCAILMEILEHVPDVYSVLDSVDAVVKPGGYVFITVPFTHLEKVNSMILGNSREFPEHVRRFSPGNIPMYFKDKKDLYWEEIVAESGLEEQKWLGIRYRVS